MNEEYKFPNIDTSYWKTQDKQWVADRKAEWQRIEPMLQTPKSGKGKTAVKQYFLKGKMPDWEKMAWWDSWERHVDLFMFLWLHPSWDEAILRQLRDTYITSGVIMHSDLDAGFGNLLRWGGVMACQDYSEDSEEEMKDALVTDGHNELLFDIMMGDLNKKEYEILSPIINEYETYTLPSSELRKIHTMGRWLCIEEMKPINNDMLFQYDKPLEWWYQSCTKDEDYFEKEAQSEAVRKSIEKALWRIYHFDTDKEGDSPRSRFVTKMQTILNERPFIKEFEEMWQRVKAGKVTVDNPWER